jgi:uncharacterized protein
MVDDSCWIQTFSGKRFYPLDPRPEDVDIIDIAHALSMNCRFNGHVNHFYSVAQHCFIASFFCPDHLWALMHDAAEAYLTDIPRPIKPSLTNYQEIEDTLLQTIAVRFGLPWPVPESIKEIDNRMLVTERRDLMTLTDYDWGIKAKPLPEVIIPLPITVVKQHFLHRFKELSINND